MRSMPMTTELCRIPTVTNGRGTIQIMSKPNMKKNKISSPNMADSVMMAMFYELEEEVTDNLSEQRQNMQRNNYGR